MRRRGAALILALLLLAPLARAGTEAAPEVDDEPDQREARVDLLSAWFEAERDGLRFTIKVVALRGAEPDHLYHVAFTVEGKRHWAGLGFTRNGTLLALLSPLDPADSRLGLETLAEGLEDVRFTPGRPATLTALIPYDRVPGLREGATIIDLAASTTVYDRRAGDWVARDERASSATYELRVGLPFTDELARAGLALAAGAAGLVVAYAMVRRAHDPREIVRTPPKPPARAEPAAPPRIRLAPPPEEPR